MTQSLQSKVKLREIKYRAWNYESDIMLSWDEIKDPILDGTEIINNLSDVLTGELPMVPMMFTGVRDVKGTEIYEGDIVENFRREVSIVVFQQGAINCKNKTGDFSSVHRRLKVIGNIFE